MKSGKVKITNSTIVMILTDSPIDRPLTLDDLIELKSKGAEITLTRDINGYGRWENVPVRQPS